MIDDKTEMMRKIYTVHQDSRKYPYNFTHHVPNGIVRSIVVISQHSNDHNGLFIDEISQVFRINFKLIKYRKQKFWLDIEVAKCFLPACLIV